MNKSAVSVIVTLCALGAAAPNACADAAKMQPAPTSPAAFVQSFYDWYVFRKNNEPDVKGTETALKQKKQFFDAVLYKELVEDEAAAAKSPGEIVGLDFDPFVASNGLIYGKYQTAASTTKGTTYRVPIYGIAAGKKTAKPVLEAEVGTNNGRCVFTNFHYGKTEFPENENLLSVLGALRQERQKSGK